LGSLFEKAPWADFSVAILRDARLWRALRMRTECAAAVSTGSDAA
jgi:hypothetical protein